MFLATFLSFSLASCVTLRSLLVYVTAQKTEVTDSISFPNQIPTDYQVMLIKAAKSVIFSESQIRITKIRSDQQADQTLFLILQKNGCLLKGEHQI